MKREQFTIISKKNKSENNMYTETTLHGILTCRVKHHQPITSKITPDINHEMLSHCTSSVP